jgi:hypothetical protein
MSHDYSEFKDETKIADTAFAALNALVDQARQSQKKINSLGTELATEQEVLRNVLWVRLPAMMQEMGLKQFKTLDGTEINVKDEIVAHITEEKKLEAHRWLDDNGHGGLIKREVSVAFNREQQEMATALVNELAERFAATAEKKVVHPQTLKAWAKEMLKDGKSFPLELFGVKRFQVAKIPDLKEEKA